MLFLPRKARLFNSDPSFAGGSGWAGRNQPGSAGHVPRVGASLEEKAGGCMLVEKPEARADVPAVLQRSSRRGEMWKSYPKTVARPFAVLQVLEGDEVSHACEGQEGGVPRENCPVGPEMRLLHRRVRHTYCELDRSWGVLALADSKQQHGQRKGRKKCKCSLWLYVALQIFMCKLQCVILNLLWKCTAVLFDGKGGVGKMFIKYACWYWI